MLITIIILVAGFLVGLLLQGRVKLPTGMITLISICLLLFILGLEIGSNKELLGNLPSMGLIALLVAVFTLLGSITLTKLLTRHSGCRSRSGSGKKKEEREDA